MKILAIAVSALAFSALGLVMFFTNWHHSIDPLNWVTTLAIMGLIYCFVQNTGIAQMSSGDAIGASIDLGFSSLPVFVFGAALLQGSADWREYVIYGFIILTDIPNIVSSMRMLSLSSEITPGR